MSDNATIKERESIKVEYSIFEKVLGVKIANSFIKEKLNALGCKISENKKCN